MRNGLTKTLAAIAIACLGYQAYAVAPVVNEIPAVFVTDDTQGVTGATTLITTPNTYVYEDFVSLNDYVSDDGPLSTLTWSYRGAGTDGASNYRLNGAAPLADADSRVSPPAGSVINSATNIAAVTDRGDSTAGEYNPDSDVVTPTIRDNVLSPLNSFYLTGYTDTSGNFVGEELNSDVITLYASDGTTFGQHDMMVYSVKGEVDHLSYTPAPTPVSVRNLNFATATNGWVTASQVGNASFQSGTAGMCITVDGPTDLNLGMWVSPYGGAGGIPLVANSVWRVRAQMTTDQTTTSRVPLWDLLVQNLNVDATAGDQAYLGDYLFLDNVGDANAIKGPSAGRNVFDMWYTPSAVMTQQWNDGTDGVFTTANDPNNDMEMIFRVLDAGASGGYGGDLDSGQICVTNLNVDRFDLSKLYTVGNPDVYDLEPMVSGTNGVSIVNYVADNLPGTPGSGTVSDFSGGVLTMTPADPAGWLLEATLITPGNNVNPPLGIPADAPEIADNYPITWESDTLYQIMVEASAPNATAEDNGPDAILVSYDTKTNELLGDSYILTGLGRAGMPKVGPPQTYTTFFYSHSTTNEASTNANRLRWKIFVLNTGDFNKPLPPGYVGDPSRNLGGVTIHSVKVRKVQFIGMN